MAPGKRDVLDLLIPLFSGSKDEFGKNVVPPLPLLYDRVNEKRPPLASSAFSILFRLPMELLSPIIQLLSPTSLASLALVSRDCRQLARSRQFASVCLDYGKTSFELLRVLLEEGSERVRNGLTTSPSLGACIRRLTVKTNPALLSRLHNIALDEAFINLEESVRNKRLADAETVFFDSYIPAIQMAIAVALPHLELLDWEDRINVPRSFFTSISRSPIQHLKLFRVQVDEQFELEPTDAISWRLRTLYLELSWQFFDHSEGSITPICHSILRSCAPTLESLAWATPPPYLKTRTADSQFGLGDVRFPCLTQLELEGMIYPDCRTLSTFLGVESECRLRVLQVDTERDEMTSLFFENRGMIPSLETFVWASHLPADHTLGFLRCNSQLFKLDISSATNPTLLEERLLPLLSRSFSRLRSLRLVWEGTFIPDSALETISSLKSLEQICLSAGEQFGPRCDWLIDHDAMQRNLAKLTGLRKMAFSRDSYPTPDLTDIDCYYSWRIPTDVDGQLWEDIVRQEVVPEQVWESQHREMILVEANKYLQILPNLEWLYFGQLPMHATERDDESDRYSERYGGREKKAVILSEERDDCYTLLNTIFGADKPLLNA